LALASPRLGDGAGVTGEKMHQVMKPVTFTYFLAIAAVLAHVAAAVWVAMQ
jgi:hypothetical protein